MSAILTGAKKQDRPQPPGAASGLRTAVGSSLGGNWLSKYWIVIALLLLIAISTLLSPAFFSLGNFLNILRQVAINGILAVGLTFVILSGGIDLSTGGVLQGAGMVYATLSTGSLVPAIAATLTLGALAGTINGILANRFRFDPFLVTLGMWVFMDGFSLWVNKGLQMSVASPAFKYLGQSYLAGIPVSGIVFLIVALTGHIVTTYTVFGRSLFAIGGNESAAYLSGLPVVRYRIIAYAMSGLMAGLAGIIMVGRLSQGDPTVGYGLALDAVAATVVGGTRLGGGRGRVWGTVLGALLLGILNNLFNLMNVSPSIQLMARGVIIIAAVSLSRRSK